MKPPNFAPSVKDISRNEYNAESPTKRRRQKEQSDSDSLLDEQFGKDLDLRFKLNPENEPPKKLEMTGSMKFTAKDLQEKQQ